MKKNNVSRLKEIILKSNSFKTCLNSLNIDINSLFLLYFQLLEDAIVDYNPINDYEYLLNLSSFFEIAYQKINKHKKILYRPNILKLKKIYKSFMGIIDQYDQEYFKCVFAHLENMLVPIQKNSEELYIDDSLYDILYKAIFTFQNLEYFDILLEKNSNFVNIKKNNVPIFVDVFFEYLSCLNNNDSKSSYYIRVLNKFLNEETFDLSNQIRNNILDTLNDFLTNNKCNEKDLIDLKNLLCLLKKQYVVNLFNINDCDYELSSKDLESLEECKNYKHDRVKVNEHIITIDCDNSLVLDDGISVRRLKNGNILFKIHITDPLAIFSYYSELIQEAKKRTTTIYEDDHVIQMLPTFLSTDKLSLNALQERFAKTFYFEYNKEEGIVYFKIINTIITVNQRTTYSEFNELYRKGGNDENEYEMLLAYEEILKYLKKIFKNAKIYEEIKNSNFNDNNQKNTGFAENLVNHLMMFTGYKTAEYFYKNNLPFVYRCHQIDHKWNEYLEQCMRIQDEEVYKNMLKEIKGKIPKSYYSSENIGHFGLKIPNYSHITSPLRRFCDILNMHCINTCYFKIPTDKQIYQLEREVKVTAEYLNMQNNSIEEYLNKGKIKIK